MPNSDIQPSGNAAAAGGGTAKIVYIVYLCSVVFWVLAVVGLIISYVNRNDAPEWAASHYRFQIRTFWIGLLFSVVAGVAVFIYVGVLLFLAALVWWIVRCAKGLKYVSRSEPYPNVTTWLW